MRRRDLLKITSAGAVAAASGPNLISGGSTSPAERIGVALIGASNMGGKTHLPTLVGNDLLQLRAICDVDSEVLADRLAIAREDYAKREGRPDHRGIEGTGDFRELLDRDNIDAVVIATPDQWHVPMAKAFVNAGKAVYVEKPLSLFVSEGRELARLVKRRNAIVQVGTQRRSTEQNILVSELLRNGVYGDIRHVEIRLGTRGGSAEPWSPQPVPPHLDYEMWVGPGAWSDYHPERVHYNFRFVSAYSGGDVTNLGAHYLDVAQWGLGLDETGPVSVSGTGQRHPEGALHDVFHDVDVNFAYANGTALRFRGTDLPFREHAVIFHGENGTLTVGNKALVSDPPELLRQDRGEFSLKYRKTAGGHLDNWVECIRANRPDNLHAPVEIGHRSATACHLVNIAMLTGRPLHWDPDAETFRDDEEADKLLSRPLREPWVF